MNNKTLLWVSIALKFLDVSLTTYIVTIWGITAESNPLIRNAINNYGIIPTMIVITLGYIALVYLLYKRNRRKLLLIVIGLMSLLIIVNTLATMIQ